MHACVCRASVNPYRAARHNRRPALLFYAPLAGHTKRASPVASAATRTQIYWQEPNQPATIHIKKPPLVSLTKYGHIIGLSKGNLRRRLRIKRQECDTRRALALRRNILRPRERIWTQSFCYISGCSEWRALQKPSSRATQVAPGPLCSSAACEAPSDRWNLSTIQFSFIHIHPSTLLEQRPTGV